MKKTMLALGALVLPIALSTTSVQANPSVTLVDSDTLRVVDRSGKPPFKRLTISQDSNPGLFAHYHELINYDPQPLFAVSGRGAPGKSVARQRVRISGDATEIAEFARFEEVDEAAETSARMWRGAPGKSIR